MQNLGKFPLAPRGAALTDLVIPWITLLYSFPAFHCSIVFKIQFHLLSIRMVNSVLGECVPPM